MQTLGWQHQYASNQYASNQKSWGDFCQPVVEYKHFPMVDHWGKKWGGGHSTLACVNLALEIVFPSTALDTKKKYVCEWVIKAWVEIFT